MKLETNSRFVNWAGWASCATLVVALFVFVLTLPRMPSYQGRSAEKWLRSVFSYSSTGTSQSLAIAAFRAMGTNGVKFLVKALDRPDTTLNQLYVQWFNKFPAALRQSLPEPVSADTLASAASLVLLNISDETPRKTFSQLMSLLDAKNPRTRLHVSSVVGQYIARYPEIDLTPYRPQLVRALGDTNDWMRFNIGASLLRFYKIFPELTDSFRPALTNANPDIRVAAAMVLSQLSAIKSNEITHVP